MYKEAKLFGKNEDGDYLARIEEIGTGQLFDTLYISNRHDNAWALSIFTGYRQIGTFDMMIPHDYDEGDDIIAIVKDGKIVSIRREP